MPHVARASAGPVEIQPLAMDTFTDATQSNPRTSRPDFGAALHSGADVLDARITQLRVEGGSVLRLHFAGRAKFGGRNRPNPLTSIWSRSDVESAGAQPLHWVPVRR